MRRTRSRSQMPSIHFDSIDGLTPESQSSAVLFLYHSPMLLTGDGGLTYGISDTGDLDLFIQASMLSYDLPSRSSPLAPKSHEFWARL